MTTILYHSTSREAAEAILANGFRDNVPEEFEGPDCLPTVYVSRCPSEIMGAKGPYLLEISLQIEQHELETYRCQARYVIATDEQIDSMDGGDVDDSNFEADPEAPELFYYSLPAALLNTRGKVRLIEGDERTELLM